MSPAVLTTRARDRRRVNIAGYRRALERTDVREIKRYGARYRVVLVRGLAYGLRIDSGRWRALHSDPALPTGRGGVQGILRTLGIP